MGIGNKKKRLIIVLKDFMKQPVIKQVLVQFFTVFLLIECCIIFFLLFYQGVCKFRKIDEISLASFHCI